jgi:Ran GTPase-activating protein (RanGAP) involved in mRNA processing and transport
MPCPSSSLLATTPFARKQHLERHGVALRTVHVTSEEAHRILARWERQLSEIATSETEIQVIDLSCRSWHPDVFAILVPFLTEHVASVRSLILDDMIASLDTPVGLALFELLAETFSQCSSVETLSFADNAIGDRGVECLRPLLALPTLKRFNFENTGLGKNILQALLQENSGILVDVAHQLEELKLGRNEIAVLGAPVVGQFLSMCPNLKRVYYNGCRPRAKGTIPICEGLVSCKHLTELVLGDCTLRNGDETDDPIHSLLPTLTENAATLRKLDLSGTNLEGREGIARILQALAGSSLEYLDVGGNDLADEGIDELVDFFTSGGGENLQVLKLENTYPGETSLAHLLSSLTTTCPKLQRLDLSDNSLEPELLNMLVEYPISTLTFLNLESNDDDQVDDEVLEQLRALYPRRQEFLPPTIVITEEDRNEVTDYNSRGFVGDEVDVYDEALYLEE